MQGDNQNENAKAMAEYMQRVFRRGHKYTLKEIAAMANIPYDSLAFRAEYVVKEGVLSIQEDLRGIYWIRLANDSIT